MTIKANELQSQYIFQIDSPPLLKSIQNMVAKFNESIQCPPEVTYILQMLNNKYGLSNIGHVCLKVLGRHHASYTSSAHVKDLGWQWVVFSFLALKNMTIQGHLLFMISQ